MRRRMNRFGSKRVLSRRRYVPFFFATILFGAASGAADAADVLCSFTQIAAAQDHLCGITPSGAIRCMGTPKVAATPSGTFTSVVTGYNHACAIRDDGTAACWGQVCYPYPYSLQCSPATLGLPGGQFTQLSAGSSNSCGLRPDNSLECWGSSSFWQQYTIPTGPFVEIASGTLHGCGLTASGEIDCWGYNQHHSADSPPADTVPPIDDFTSVVSGGNSLHNCALRGGEAVCWGWNSYGQTEAPGGTFTQLAAGGYHSCGLRPDGTAECWGDASHGQDDEPADAFTQIAAGYGFTCGLLASGNVKCWGLDTDGGAAPIECPVCGNGLVATSEDCDDGNLDDGDGCSSDCEYVCGDGYLAPTEECDDGNLTDADGCDINCTATGCGNGHRTDGEQCDDGDSVDGDGCDTNCTATACHNGIQTSGEECDDGNLEDYDGCSECRVACPVTPQSGCRTASYGGLVIKDDLNSLIWKWKRGADTQWLDFNDFAAAGFDLCLYPDAGDIEYQVILRGSDHWSYVGGDPDEPSESTRGQRYRHPFSQLPALDIRYGDEGRSSIQAKISTFESIMPSTGQYTVQLIDLSTDTCWESAFSGGSLRPGRYSAKIAP